MWIILTNHFIIRIYRSSLLFSTICFVISFSFQLVDFQLNTCDRLLSTILTTALLHTLQLASQNVASKQGGWSEKMCWWTWRDSMNSRAAGSVTSLLWCKWRRWKTILNMVLSHASLWSFISWSMSPVYSWAKPCVAKTHLCLFVCLQTVHKGHEEAHLCLTQTKANGGSSDGKEIQQAESSSLRW